MRRNPAGASLGDCGRRGLAPRLKYRAGGARLNMWRAPYALRGSAVAPLAVAPHRARIAIFALGSARGAKHIPRATGRRSRAGMADSRVVLGDWEFLVPRGCRRQAASARD